MTEYQLHRRFYAYSRLDAKDRFGDEDKFEIAELWLHRGRIEPTEISENRYLREQKALNEIRRSKKKLADAQRTTQTTIPNLGEFELHIEHRSDDEADDRDYLAGKQKLDLQKSIDDIVYPNRRPPVLEMSGLRRRMLIQDKADIEREIEQAGKWVRHVRGLYGINRNEFADKLGVAVEVIVALENGYGEPDEIQSVFEGISRLRENNMRT